MWVRLPPQVLIMYNEQFSTMNDPLGYNRDWLDLYITMSLAHYFKLDEEVIHLLWSDVYRDTPFKEVIEIVQVEYMTR